MSTILSCPSCANPLRVPDELLGQKVRCPTCSNVFTTPASTRTEDREQEPPSTDARESGAGWKELSLELSVEEPPGLPRQPEQPGQPAGLVGAVELNLSLDDDAPAPPACHWQLAASATPPKSPPSDALPSNRPLPPRLAEEDDDLKPCPACGKSIHRNARDCDRCGEDLSDHRPRSMRRSREPIRRDAEPHRGNMILTLGILSLVVMCVPLVGLGFGLTAWLMGRSDLRKIRSGQMDRDGKGSTQSGQVCGIIGTCLNGLMSLCCVGYCGVLFTAMHATPAARPWAPPPPTMQPAPMPPIQPAPMPPLPGPQWKDKR